MTCLFSASVRSIAVIFYQKEWFTLNSLVLCSDIQQNKYKQNHGNWYILSEMDSLANPFMWLKFMISQLFYRRLRAQLQTFEYFPHLAADEATMMHD